MKKIIIILILFYTQTAFAFGMFGGGGGGSAADDTAYNATSWDSNTDAATKNAIRDKIETLAGGHDAVTLGTANGLSLSNQELSLAAATNATPGAATAAQITALEAIDTEAELEALLDLQDLNGAVTDAQVPNDITVNVAAEVTASANNSTDETVYPVFVDGATGTQGAETDTGLTYNPSTGILTVGGISISPTALGGQYSTWLEDTDLGSNYTGWGAFGNYAHDTVYTSPITVNTEGQCMVFSAPSNQTMSDGTTKSIASGSFITPLEKITGTNPTTDTAGDIAVDSDDNFVEIYGSESRSIPTEFPITWTVYKPNELDDAQRDFLPFFTNNTGASITITKIYAMADIDDCDFRIEEYDADGSSNEALVKAETCDTGSGPYTNDAQSTITNPTIENGHVLVFDSDDTDIPDYIHFTIWYTVGGVD